MKKISYNTAAIPTLVRRQDLFYNKIRKIAQEIKLDEVTQMQSAMIDLSNNISTNQSQAESFLKAHIIGGTPIDSAEVLKNNIKSFTESISSIGSPGNQRSPDGVWGKRTDVALEKISAFSNSLNEFFIKNGWTPNQKITDSIQDLNGLIALKHFQTTTQQKKENADKITPILNNIKNLFSSIPNMIKSLKEKNKQVNVDISGSDQATSTPAKPTKQAPGSDAETDPGDSGALNQEIMTWWDDTANIENSLNTGALDNLIEKLFPGQIDTMKKMPIKDFIAKMKPAYLVYLKGLDPDKISQEFRQSHDHNTTDTKGAKKQPSNKVKSDQQVLETLHTLLPLNKDQINIPKIEDFVSEYEKYSPSRQRPELLSSVNNAINGLKRDFNNIYFRPLRDNYSRISIYVNTNVKNKDDPKNVSNYLNYLYQIVDGVGAIVYNILQTAATSFEKDEKNKEDFLKQSPQRATGNIYDINLTKIEEWIDDLRNDLARGNR